MLLWQVVPGGRIYEAVAKFEEGRKVGLLLLEMQPKFTAQDAATYVQPFGLVLCALLG